MKAHSCKKMKDVKKDLSHLVGKDLHRGFPSPPLKALPFKIIPLTPSLPVLVLVGSVAKWLCEEGHKRSASVY